MIKEEIINLIKKAVIDLGVSEKDIPDFTLEHPDEMSHGDYATNVSLILSKILKQSPIKLAQQIVDSLNKNKSEQIEKIEVAGPGFINFYLTHDYFKSQIADILKLDSDYGQNNNLNGKKTIIEYTDPNPFKEFHIGHLMNNSIGESISRIIEANGSKIIRVSYGGDVGLHVAKSIYAVLQQKEKIAEIKQADDQTQLSFWAKSYVAGSTAYDENPQAKVEIGNLNKIILDKSDAEINELYDWGREISIAHFQIVFKRLDTNFEHNFWESEVVPDAMKAVEEGLNKNILEKSDGAIVFKGENYGLHTRVFVNSKGVPTYEAKELGLGVKKIELYDFDSSIVITGNEQNDYFKVLLKVIGLLRPEIKDKTTHIGLGMLRFTSGKMSSRKGNVITGISLLAQVKEIVLEKMKERDFSEADKETIAEVITIGAIRYSILKQTSGKDIIFDFEKSLSFEGDSGPYLQYACVRAKSILEKAEKEGIKAELDSNSPVINNELVKLLIRFPEIIERAGKEYSPHYLATYLTELASSFSAFYAQEIVVDKSDTNSPTKVALTKAFSIVIRNGLNLLGIKVPERM